MMVIAATIVACGFAPQRLATAHVPVSVNIGVPIPPPVVLAAPPPLVVVAPVPTVSYVPSASVDLFVFGGLWYYPHRGYWYVGPTYRGPWAHVAVSRLPRPILAVPAPYYRVPPGHLKAGGGPPGHARGKGKGHR
jgi:hypothetical protein